MNQLTFQSGTFAGQTIRTTTDGYASVYDIIRVAGVGSNAVTVWTDLKTRSEFQTKFQTTSNTSDSRPLTKNFKFSGRGQRDTPVVSGQGLVRLLFLLPGKRARQFVAESAEVLVRHIGGDETLVEEIRRNREIGQTNPQSAQAFMAANIPDNTIAIASVDGGLELEERRARLVKLLNDNERQKEENKAYKLEVLDRYRVYAMEYIDDPRIKEQINNEVTNQLLASFKPDTTQRQIADVGAPVLASSALVTIDQVATETMSLRLTTNQKCRIGHAVAARYRILHPLAIIETVEKYVNGEMRPVKAYPREFEGEIVKCINNFLG